MEPTLTALIQDQRSSLTLKQVMPSWPKTAKQPTNAPPTSVVKITGTSWAPTDKLRKKLLNLVTLKYPQRRDEIVQYVRKRHYSKRCPGVWSRAHLVLNDNDRILGVSLAGTPPYPSIARAFCRRSEDIPRLTWQSRMCGMGISRTDLDSLIQYAITDLTNAGYYYFVTLTDPVQKTIDGALAKLDYRGFTGECYHRNNFLFLGSTKSSSVELWLVDGVPIHPRQGNITLNSVTIRERFKDAKSIRAIRGNSKDRWAYILHRTQAEYAERHMLMKYGIQPWRNLYQPRLLYHLSDLLSSLNSLTFREQRQTS